MEAPSGWELDPGFDLEAFLARPLVARLATAGPTVRPLWFLWEDRRFWWLTGRWSRLADRLQIDARVALVIDTCDLDTGEVLQVTASGQADVVPFDAGRARRKLRRYLGSDESRWDARFSTDTFSDPSTRFVSFPPQKLRARDLSFSAARGSPAMG